jgi:hypothetical protein
MNKSQTSLASAPRPNPPARGKTGERRGRPAYFSKRLPPVSRDAQRMAAAILEVLAGVRTPTDAATALSIPLPRYYLWEQRALTGLVRACEPRPAGRAAHERHQIAVLEKEVRRLELDCARHQALVRASQRTIGLIAPPSPNNKSAVQSRSKTGAKSGETSTAKTKRKRRPVARALMAVAALQALPGEAEILADSSSSLAAEVVQQSLPSSSLAAAEAASVITAGTET